MKVCIYGAGSIGGYIAGHLAKVEGVEVSLIARGAHLAAIRDNGLRVITSSDDFTVRLPASDDPSDFGPQDYVFITLKSHQVEPALESMTPLLGPQTAVLPPTTGIPYWYFHGVDGPHAGKRLEKLDPGGRQWAALDPARVIGCVYWVGTDSPAPGVARQAGAMAHLPLGEPSGAVTPRLTRLAEAMKAGGLTAPIKDNIRGEIWVKMINSMCWNPVAVLSTATLGEINARAELVDIVRRMMAEAEAVMAALGVPVPVPMEERIAGTATLVNHKMSMLQDLEKGRPMEIDVMRNSISTMCSLAGVETPMIDAMLALTRMRADKAGL
ncbi:MAG: 2-dehydropantoate 2-reductase [Alphaproteobacteria bacterium]|nr:2-dehydropantoate 2-reductase [Alphaproteobacteria bacterium]